jgi:hypothetical protein
MGFTRPPKAQVIYATNLQTISIQKLADLLKSVKKRKAPTFVRAIQQTTG